MGPLFLTRFSNGKLVIKMRGGGGGGGGGVGQASTIDWFPAHNSETI